MSNFQPYSAGDHFAWQQAQQGDRAPSSPLPPAEQAAVDQRAADEAERRSLSSTPGSAAIAGTIVADLIARHPDRALDHVVDVEYRRLRTLTGRAAAFKVWPIGNVKTSWKDSSFDKPAAMDAQGRVFHLSNQDANVAMSPSMRWQLSPIAPENYQWIGHVIQKLRAQQGGADLPPVRQGAPRRAESRPVTPRQKRRADAIRRGGMRDAVAISNLSSIYEKSAQQGPPSAHERRKLKELERLRARMARRQARADRVEGKAPHS